MMSRLMIDCMFWHCNTNFNVENIWADSTVIRKKKGEFDRKNTANLSGFLQGEIVNKWYCMHDECILITENNWAIEEIIQSVNRWLYFNRTKIDKTWRNYKVVIVINITISCVAKYSLSLNMHAWSAYSDLKKIGNVHERWFFFSVDEDSAFQQIIQFLPCINDIFCDSRKVTCSWHLANVHARCSTVAEYEYY